MQVLRAFKTGYCQPPPPGCPRNIYKLMVDCWWVQQWLASQNLLLKLESVTGGYIYGVNEWNCHTANLTPCTSFDTHSQAFLLCGSSVDFVLFAKCLCSHHTTPSLSPKHAHPNVCSFHLIHTLYVYTALVRTGLQPIISPRPTLYLQEPRTQHTSDIWRHHSGPGQRPCSTAELESTGQRNLFQSLCLGSNSGEREASLPRPAEQVLVVEIPSF